MCVRSRVEVAKRRTDGRARRAASKDIHRSSIRQSYSLLSCLYYMDFGACQPARRKRGDGAGADGLRTFAPPDGGSYTDGYRDLIAARTLPTTFVPTKACGSLSEISAGRPPEVRLLRAAKSSRRSDRLSTPAACFFSSYRHPHISTHTMTSVPLDQFDRTFGSLIGELPPSRLRTADAICLRRDASQSSLVKPSVQRSSRSPTSSSQTPRASSACP